MKKAKLAENPERITVKQPGAPKTYKEVLVNRYLVEWGKDEKEEAKKVGSSRAQALAWARTFFELNEVQCAALQLFELTGKVGVEHNGVSIIPMSPGAACLVFRCPYCDRDCSSETPATTLADLGRLIYEESQGALEPEQEHLRKCSKAPAESIRKEGYVNTEPKALDLLEPLIAEIIRRSGVRK